VDRNQTAVSISSTSLSAGFVTAITLGIVLPLTPDRLTAANHALDGGDLLAAILTNGVPHPTGYPTYLVLGRIVQMIPLGTPYWRGALLSSIPAALAAGLLTFLVARRGINQKGALASGLIAGLAWGTAPAFLSQAVIVEVHGLQALFTILAMWWLVLLSQNPKSRSALLTCSGLALFYGIGLGNHLTLIFFLPLIVYFIGQARQRGMSRNLIGGQIGLVACGLLVYLYLPFQARHYPPVNWGNPQTWQGFTWLLFARPYQGLVFALPDISLGNRILAWFDLFRGQFGVIGLCIGAAGASLLIESERRIFGVMGWIFISYSIFAIGYSSADSAVYLIPAYMTFAGWIAFAVQSTWELRWRNIPCGKLLGTLTILYFFARIPVTYQQIDPRKDFWPDAFAIELLESAPQEAIIFTVSDPDTFSLWYHHYGLGKRLDLVVVAEPLTQFDWYQQTLTHTYPNLTFPDQTAGQSSNWAESLTQLNSHHPICRTFQAPSDPAKLRFACEPPGIISIVSKQVSWREWAVK